MMDERSMVLRTNDDINRALTFIAGLAPGLDPEHPWEIVVRLYKLKRTILQNKRYHAVCAEICEQLVAAGNQYEPDHMKEYFKRMFIGATDVKMPDGSTLQYGISTTTLNTAEFAIYMTKIDAWATSNGVIFEATRQMLDDYAKQAREWRERHRNDPELRT